MNKILATDLFCGAGGFSAGLLAASQGLCKTTDLLAINHWPQAIDVHKLNNPGVRHLCENLDNVDPRKTVAGGRLDLLLASPECTHHSNARGGKPMSDQSRASAWHVVRWAEALCIENLVIENVREFQTWGPLDDKGRPLKHKKGELFRAWLNCLVALGYKVDFKILNSAWYGAATARERLFVLASRKRRPRWPEKSHGADAHLFAPPYRSAREIIDWSLKGNSIFGRKKPLADKTLLRIAAGLKKFNGMDFVLGQQSCAAPRSVDSPLPTIATAGAISLVEPFLVKFHGDRHKTGDCAQRVYSVDEPLLTLDTSNRYALCEPFIMNIEHQGDDGDARRCTSLDKPLPTLTTSQAFALCEPFLVSFKGQDTAASLSKPLGALTTKHRYALVEPFLVKYYGTSQTATCAEPLPTLTTNDRFGLCQPEPIAIFERDGVTYGLMDIRFRMLEPRECGDAMGFAGYEFTGTKKDRMKMIGNAVEVNTARALCGAVLQ